MDLIPVIRAGGERESRDTEPLYAVSGARLGAVCHAPPVVVDLVVRQLRDSRRCPPAQRLRVLAEAGKLFAEADLAGESPDGYVCALARATGLPTSVGRVALGGMRDALAILGEVVDTQRPTGAQFDGSGPATARWVPRGRVLGVVAPSNHPMVHIEWLLALALGYRIAIRPGHRDPFTPRRLVRALLAAGLPADWVAMLPGPHATGDRLIAAADLGLVYGTERAVARYRDSTRVLTRGPGRTKALVVGSRLSEAVLEQLLQEIAGDGGVRCTNISVVFCESGHDRLAAALADRLAALPVLPPTDERAVLPAHATATATALRDALGRTLGPEATLVSREPLVPLDGDQAVLLPAVIRCDRADHPALRTELPFPCVWVAPWRRTDGLAVVRDSLALLLPAGCDGPLLDELLDDPSIRMIVHGCRGDWWQDPLLPHDGYLGGFLMDVRGYATDRA